MNKLILLGFISVYLTACSFLPIHRIEVEQGNILAPEHIRYLHHGMSENQVKKILGKPILVNVIDSNQLIYIYTSQVGSHSRTEKRVVLTFRQGALHSIQCKNI